MKKTPSKNTTLSTSKVNTTPTSLPKKQEPKTIKTEQSPQKQDITPPPLPPKTEDVFEDNNDDLPFDSIENFIEKDDRNDDENNDKNNGENDQEENFVAEYMTNSQIETEKQLEMLKKRMEMQEEMKNKNRPQAFRQFGPNQRFRRNTDNRFNRNNERFVEKEDEEYDDVEEFIVPPLPRRDEGDTADGWYEGFRGIIHVSEGKLRTFDSTMLLPDRFVEESKRRGFAFSSRACNPRGKLNPAILVTAGGKMEHLPVTKCGYDPKMQMFRWYFGSQQCYLFTRDGLLRTSVNNTEYTLVKTSTLNALLKGV
jgi:hypothetical protein